MIDLTVVGSTVSSLFGEAVTIHSELGRFEESAIHSSPSMMKLRPDRAPYKDIEHKLYLTNEVFNRTGVGTGDQIDIGATEYFVADVVPEDSGLTLLILKPI